jgi:hypothetical protein
MPLTILCHMVYGCRVEKLETTWTDANGDAWIIEFDDDDHGLHGVTIRSATGDKNLTLTLLTRGIPLGELLEKARVKRRTTPIPDGTTWVGKDGRTWTPHGDLQLVEEAPPKRRTITPVLMQEVADIYNAAATERRPTQVVADRFFVSHSTAARWVGLARRKPYETLPPTQRGVQKGSTK